MSQEVSFIFSGFVSVLFMLVGVFGIYKKRKLARSTQTMHKLNGVQVDYYAVDDQDEDGFTTTSYFPIYEYEYGGIKQQLRCDYGESGKRYRSTGRKVHILIDPQTGKAVCLEDESKNQSILLVFGGIGIVAFVLVLVVWLGKLS